MTHHTAEHRSDAMNRCIRDCLDCASVCLETIHYCLEQGGEHAAPQHIGLMQTCAELCTLSAHTMLRGVEAHAVVCGACAEICRRCADDCASMGDDADMRRCVDACRRCEESCCAMAQAA